MFDLHPWSKKETRHLGSIRDEMNQLFDRFFESSLMRLREGVSGDILYPSVNISEGRKEIVVKAEIPGVEEEDINLSLNGKVLILKAEKRREQKEEEKDYHRIERSHGVYKRSIDLPAEVDQEDVEAVYKKGVLTITLKKIRESETKRIAIKST